MCGTFTQIAGMALGLYGIDLLIKPAFAGSEAMGMFLFVIKGVVQYYIYRWFQCDSAGHYTHHGFQGMSMTQIFLGGILGGITLMLAGSLVGERNIDDFLNAMVKYGIEAVILNFVYGATGTWIASM